MSGGATGSVPFNYIKNDNFTNIRSLGNIYGYKKDNIIESDLNDNGKILEKITNNIEAKKDELMKNVIEGKEKNNYENSYKEITVKDGKENNIFSLVSAIDFSWILLNKYDGIYTTYYDYKNIPKIDENYITDIRNRNTGKTNQELIAIFNSSTDTITGDKKINDDKISLVFITFSDKKGDKRPILQQLIQPKEGDSVRKNNLIQGLKDRRIKNYFAKAGNIKIIDSTVNTGTKLNQPKNFKDVFISERGIWNNENHPFHWMKGKPRKQEGENIIESNTLPDEILILYQGGFPKIIYEGPYDFKEKTDENFTKIADIFTNFLDKLQLYPYTDINHRDNYKERRLPNPRDSTYEELINRLAKEAWEGIIEKKTEPLSDYFTATIPKIVEMTIPKPPTLNENDLGYYVNQISKDDFQKEFLHEKWQDINNYYPEEEKKPEKVKMPSYISLPSLGPKGKGLSPFVYEPEKVPFLPTFDSTLFPVIPKELSEYDKNLQKILQNKLKLAIRPQQSQSQQVEGGPLVGKK